MDTSSTLSVVALAVSVFAVGLSTVLAIRQEAVQRNSNQLPLINELLGEFRRPEFHDRYKYVVERLPVEHSNELGITNLPDDARTAVLDMAYYFQTHASLAEFGISPDRRLLTNLDQRVLEIWTSIKPYVAVERLNSPGAQGTMLTVLERYAAGLEKSRSTVAHRGG